MIRCSETRRDRDARRRHDLLQALASRLRVPESPPVSEVPRLSEVPPLSEVIEPVEPSARSGEIMGSSSIELMPSCVSSRSVVA